MKKKFLYNSVLDNLKKAIIFNVIASTYIQDNNKSFNF